MASYKQPCIRCGAYIEPDSAFAPPAKAAAPLGTSAPPVCAPFKHKCQNCGEGNPPGTKFCGGCGRKLQS